MRDHYYSGVAAEKEDGDLYFEEKDPTTTGENSAVYNNLSCQL